MNSERTSTVTITIGRLLCGKVRNFLNKTKFQGYNIDFWESSGWIEREFVIRGDERAIRYVNAALEDWRRRVDSCTAH